MFPGIGAMGSVLLLTTFTSGVWFRRQKAAAPAGSRDELCACKTDGVSR